MSANTIKLTSVIVILCTVFTIGITTSYAITEEESKIPPWIKTAFNFWINDQVSDQEFLYILQYFVDSKLIDINHISNDPNLINNLQSYQLALSEKMTITQKLASNNIIRLSVIESNAKFEKLHDVESLIKKWDEDWRNAETITPLIRHSMGGAEGDILQMTILDDDKNPRELINIVEIIVTDTYGANVVVSGKTSDFYQADEEWWIHAKEHKTFISKGHFDESAQVFAADIAVSMYDDEGNFIGVVKTVINVENLT